MSTRSRNWKLAEKCAECVCEKLTPQHNRYEIGITCTNGGDPTVAGNFDGMLVVSCGK